jgi:hypothetical protein
LNENSLQSNLVFIQENNNGSNIENANNLNENSSSENNSNENSSNSGNNLNENNSNSENNLPPSEPEGSDGEFSEATGYETDSNRSFFEEGADAMSDYPATNLPDDHLRRFITDTKDIVRNPNTAGISENDVESRQA